MEAKPMRARNIIDEEQRYRVQGDSAINLRIYPAFSPHLHDGAMKNQSASIALVLLACCAHYQPQPVSAAANADALVARSIDAPVVRRLIEQQHPEVAENWPPARWTPELLTLAAIALHPDLDVARADWKTARAALRTAAERPNPTLNAGVEHKATGGDGSPWVTTLSLDVPIETAGKRGVRIAQATALATAAAADVDQAVWNVRTRAANAAVDLATSQKVAELRRAEVALRAEIVAMLEKRLAAGEAAQPDVTRVRSDDRASRLLLHDEEGRAAQREAALAASIGIASASLPALDLALPEPRAVADSEHLHTLALTARPDVLALLARYDAAEEALRLEVRSQYPGVHLAPGLGWDQGAFKWALSVSAEIPIFNRHEGPIAEAEARRAAAAAQLLAKQSQVLGDLDSALANEASARARLGEAEHLLAAKNALVASARKTFASGEIDRLALRNQEIEATLAEIDRWTAWFDLQRARIAIEASVEQPI
jgi:outer membrane protein TolC